MDRIGVRSHSAPDQVRVDIPENKCLDIVQGTVSILRDQPKSRIAAFGVR